MPEELSEQSTQQFDIGRYLDVLRRRHIQFLAPLFLGWLLVWSSSWVLPAKYKSSTMILVEHSTMPKSYVEPNVNDDWQERLQSIQQQILSRTRLLLIIDRLHLYSGKRHLLSPDEKVATMQRDIDIELVRDPQTDTINAFRINYWAPNARLAQQVTSELTNLFIDENLRVREQESEDTTEFMQNQLTTARASLADQDGKVRAFEAAHEGSLPTQQASNLEILSGLQQQLQNEEDALSTAKQQRVYHQSMIDQYRALQIPTRTAGGAPTGLAALDQQLDALQTKLTTLRARYTDQYPEVQAAKAEIARTEKQRDELIASMKNSANSKAHAPATESQDVTDPARNAPLLQLESQLQSDQLEIADREQAITSLKSRINDSQARLNAEPAVAQQLADLTRGYDQSQANYNDLLKKESDSRMATSMEQMQAGERFTMIDPPSLPLKPDFPNRLKMCAAGLGVGLALGVLVVALLEFFDDRLRGDRQIARLLPITVISEIPEILNPSDQRRNRRKIIFGWVMAGLVIAMIAAGSVFSYLRA
jgi:polysaccharide biosynthesis transport protein